MHTKNRHQTYLLPAAVEEALKRGWSVIPIGPNKKPMIKWKAYQTERASRDQVIEWDRTLKPSAWGIVTGEISGIVALDFDGREGKKRLADLKLNPHIRTGSGGAHVYFMHPGFRVPDAAPVKDGKVELTGLDLRGDGGFVVFCGNSSKGSYQQLRPLEPDPIETIPPDLRRPCKLEAVPPAARQQPARNVVTQAAAHAAVDSSKLIEKALDVCRREGRNKGGFWLAQQARDNGYSQAEAEALVLSEYRPRTPSTNAKGQPEPYTEAEARASVRQAYQQAPREPWAAPASQTASQPAPPTAPVADDANSQAEPEADPEDFELRADGLYFTQRRYSGGKWVENTTRISPPIRAVARARTFEDSGYSVFVTFDDCQGNSRRLLIPRRLLYGDGTEALNELIDRGFEPERDKSAISALKMYLCRSNPKDFIRHVSRVGWHGRAFVLPDRTIAPPGEGEQILFYVEEGTAHQYKEAGTLDQWQKHVSRLCSGNNRLLFVVSCAFAAPLLGPANLDNVGFHLFAQSSKGKTTSLYVAGSVFGGDPPQNKDGFKDTWLNTANATESKAALHNDAIMLLDEIALCPAKDISDTIYFLGNGQGKGRSQKSGGLRATQTFRVLFLSTGEKTIEDHLSDGGQQLRGGHDVRLIQIPAEYSKGMGVFEKLHEHKTAMEFATTLGNAARRYYGTPIRRFLELLANDRDKLLGDLRQLSADFFTANLPKHAHSETQRKLKHFAHVAAAGEIATRLGITGWKNGEAAEAVRRCWLDMLAQRGGEGPQDVERGISQLRRFILTQGETRFLRLDWKDEREEEGQKNLPRTFHCAGYIGQEEIDGHTETVYFIIPEVMKEDILKGSDVSNVARELRRRGHLLPDKAPSRSLQYRKRLPLPGSKETKPMRVYAVLASILEDPSSAEEQ
jgi:uncharacterized protein (DUF927 family)